jgi:hypothetical protein
MAEPLPPTTLAWLRQTAKFEGAVTAQVLLHLLERVEVLEAADHFVEVPKMAPTPEAALAAEPVGEGPTDEELDDFIARVWPHSPGEMPDDEWRHGMAETIRAAVDEIGLARWAHPATPPAPEPGEAGELVEWIRSQVTIDPAAQTQWAKRFLRIATLLSQQAAPAPVVVPVAPDELEGSNG